MDITSDSDRGPYPPPPPPGGPSPAEDVVAPRGQHPLGPHRSATVLRWTIVGVVLIAGIALLATGHVVAGGLLTLLGGLRMALLVSMRRRRTEIRARLEARRARLSPGGSATGRAPHPGPPRW